MTSIVHRDGSDGHEYLTGTYVYSDARATETDDCVGIVTGYRRDQYANRYTVEFSDGYTGDYPEHALSSVDLSPTR